MAIPISQFFAKLGLPLRNVRWSWGAKDGAVLLLRTWADEFSSKERSVRVLRDPGEFQYSDSYGLDERIGHLESLWTRDVAGYTVIATAKDPKKSPREIKEYRDDVVFPIDLLDVVQTGHIRALLGQPVSVRELHKHAQQHRTTARQGPFPVPDGWRTGAASETFQEKLPSVRNWLIDVARTKEKVTYGDVMNRFGLTFFPLRNAMSRLGHDCIKQGEPVITALIVDKDTGRCSEGLAEEFGVADDEAERERCYAYWAGGPTSPKAAPPYRMDDFEERVARFARVQVRTEQAAFREAVFRLFNGRCVVTGCAVPEALEAAHISGRDWKAGDNAVSDGLLMRRDIHALYDRGLLSISATGEIAVDASINAEYGSYACRR